MTKDEIIELAKECGYWSGQTVEMNYVGLERFAALVAAAEREKCAKVCEKLYLEDQSHYRDFSSGRECADAIRARGEK